MKIDQFMLEKEYLHLKESINEVESFLNIIIKILDKKFLQNKFSFHINEIEDNKKFKNTKIDEHFIESMYLDENIDYAKIDIKYLISTLLTPNNYLGFLSSVNLEHDDLIFYFKDKILEIYKLIYKFTNNSILKNIINDMEENHNICKYHYALAIFKLKDDSKFISKYKNDSVIEIDLGGDGLYLKKINISKNEILKDIVIENFEVKLEQSNMINKINNDFFEKEVNKIINDFKTNANFEALARGMFGSKYVEKEEDRLNIINIKNKFISLMKSKITMLLFKLIFIDKKGINKAEKIILEGIGNINFESLILNNLK